jgi:hypothetical protein
MISKERLEELIEEEATIWSNAYGKTHRIMLNSTNDVLDENILWRHRNKECIRKYHINTLYETKSEAEFDAKYKRIPRTEYLDLPTWEEAEIEELVKISNNRNYCWYLIKSFTDKKNNEMFEFSLSKDDDQFYLSVNNEDSSYKDLFDKPLTYENYLEACELCKKLFIGEEV